MGKEELFSPLSGQVNMPDSRVTYQGDCEFAKLLLSGESGAWDRFYREFRTKIEMYINRKYPDVFSSVAIEEIFDGVGKRLTGNDFKAIREYRGECSFSAYVTKATEWEIKDWLRKHSEELTRESIDTIGQDDKTPKNDAVTGSLNSSTKQEDIPDIIKSLSDDLRFAFLLRYYDYFGFPLDEIRLLARKKGVAISAVTEKIVKSFESPGEDVLSGQREKQKAFQERIQKLCYQIHKLTLKEHRVTNDNDHGAFQSDDEFVEIRNRRLDLEKKRDDLLKDKSRLVVTTPYETIAEILGEDNVSTIRSRVFLAKKQITQMLTVKDR